MHLKSYFASTVESAIALAARDLGEDAMLIYSRPSSPEMQYLGKYEVVFAVEPGQPSIVPSIEPRPSAATGGETWGPALSSQVAKLDEKINRIIERIQVGQLTPTPNVIIGAGEYAVPPRAAESCERASSITAWNLIETVGNTGGACMIVGPAGAGKTTSVVKMAAMMEVLPELQPRVVSLDVGRIGGGEWLRTCSSLIGVPFSTLHTSEELAGLLSSLRPGGPVIVDTPPLNEFEPGLLSAAEKAIADGNSVSVLLALPATWKATDLRRAISLYSRLRPCAAILTQLDQTDDCRPLFQEVASAKLPVALVSEGSRIPEDIRFAPVEELTKIVTRTSREGQNGNDFRRMQPSRAAVAG